MAEKLLILDCRGKRVRDPTLGFLEDLLPGAPIWVWAEGGMAEEIGLTLRRKGLEHRDTLMVLNGTRTFVVLFFRNPRSERTTLAQVLKTGTGALNIRACKIPGFVPTPTTVRNYRRFDNKYNDLTAQGEQYELVRPERPEGRWPGNLILMHQRGCVKQDPIEEQGVLIQRVTCGPECIVPELERQSEEAGVLGSKTATGHAADGAAARFYVQLFSERELVEWLQALSR